MWPAASKLPRTKHDSLKYAQLFIVYLLHLICHLGGNELTVYYHTDGSVAQRGRGFKVIFSLYINIFIIYNIEQAAVVALNPVCSEMEFQYQYGEDVCKASCGSPYTPPEPKKCESVAITLTAIDSENKAPIPHAQV